MLAAGARVDRALLDGIEFAAHEVHLVGDCTRPRNIMSAIYQGAIVGRALDDYHSETRIE